MRGVHFFMFLVAIPMIAALGFDLYLWYHHQEKGFEFSTPGYIWTQHDPESYKRAVEISENLDETYQDAFEKSGSQDPIVWPWINFALGQKSVVLGAAFAGFFYALLLFCKILGIWPFRRGKIVYGTGSRTDDLMGKQGKKFEYKRR